jgi:FkbM family methyltransferase
MVIKTAARLLIRTPLRLLPEGLVVRVPAGPMRGMRWMPESMPHGAWLGWLERRQLDEFLRRIEPGTIVWDVGANVGLYTVPSARCARAVFAFEPIARNVSYLRRHVVLNGLSNVHIIEAAVTDHSGYVQMTSGASPSEARIGADGSCRARAVSLDDWRRHERADFPALIKIDVEGAEHEVLAGAIDTLSAARPVIFVALHGDPQRRACRTLLESAGYRITSLEPGVDAESAGEWIAEPA